MTVPLESVEQVALTNYLQANWYTFSAIRNESDFNNIAKWAKRKREWVRKWIPDFCIILKRKSVLFIELKRQRKVLKSGKLWVSPSKVSEEQLNFIWKLNECDNVSWEIAYWAKEAIKIIESYER